MRLLLDTHIFYWSFYERERLSRKALALIDGSEAIYVSSASMWEIAIKVRLGKMNADPQEMLSSIGESGFEELPVFSRHAILIAQLPLLHTDPFDRLLIATALTLKVPILSADEVFRRYTVEVLW